MRSVLTVILNWRTADMTLESCAAARREMRGLSGAITIVDNDSGDGSFEKMSAEVAAHGWDRPADPADVPVRVLQSGHNGGFGSGNNFGIRAGLPGGARPDYLYILNSDAFPDAGSIRALLDHLDTHPETGFAGSYIHGPDGEPHQTAFRFPTIWGELEGAARFGPLSRLLKRHIVALPIPETTTRVDWLAGASVMMRQEVLDRIGLFDETFFLYYEETDLFLRAARAGFPTDYVRASEVTHIGSASTGMGGWTRIPRFWLDSRRHYFTKNHGAAYGALATLAHVAGGALWRLRLLVQKKDPGDPPHFLKDLIVHYFSRARQVRPGASPDNSKTSPAE